MRGGAFGGLQKATAPAAATAVLGHGSTDSGLRCLHVGLQNLMNVNLLRISVDDFN